MKRFVSTLLVITLGLILSNIFTFAQDEPPPIPPPMDESAPAAPVEEAPPAEVNPPEGVPPQHHNYLRKHRRRNPLREKNRRHHRLREKNHHHRRKYNKTIQYEPMPVYDGSTEAPATAGVFSFFSTAQLSGRCEGAIDGKGSILFVGGSAHEKTR